MHELPVINKIVDICLQHAKKNDVKKIVAIELKVGTLSDLQPEWMQRYFDFVSKATIAAEAELVIEKMPLIYKCDECGQDFESDLSVQEPETACPNCNGTNCSIVSGNGYFISNMRVV
jgi:hydrogenase nickel incorporation protein HypA/HybF